MTVHSTSGDSTVEAIRAAVREVATEEADDHFVFAVSDANWKRYGIHPRDITEALMGNAKVHAFIIFIASFGEEAEGLQPLLPVGRSFLCLDTDKLPSIFRQMFTHSMMLT